MAERCVFCKIINKEIPATIIDENEHCLVIEDINPKAPVHYLIIPKKHVVSLHDITPGDAQLMSELLFMAQKCATTLPDPKAFGLIVNNGPEAGQSVMHLHCHFLSGKKMTDL